MSVQVGAAYKRARSSRGPLMIATGLLFASLFFLPDRSEARSVFEYWKLSQDTEAGNRSYHEGRYSEARSSYQRAGDQAGESSEDSYRLHFNQGAAYYKEGDYEKAEAEFKLALSSADPAVKGNSHYNLGNVYFQKAMQKKDVKLLEQAVAEYQAALELNPDNENAKFNIEVARRIIGKLLDEQKGKGGQCPNPQEGESKPDQNQEQDQASASQDQDPPEQDDQQKEQQMNAGESSGQEQGEEKPDAQAQPAEAQPGSTVESPDEEEQPKGLAGSTAEPEGQEEEKAQPDLNDQGQEDQEDQNQPETEVMAGTTAQGSNQEKPTGSNQPRAEMTEQEALLLLQAVEQNERQNIKDLMKVMQERRARKDKDW